MKKLQSLLLLFILLLLASCNNNEKRTTINLNGTWNIEEGTMDKIPENYTHTVQVPGLVSLAKPAFENAGPKVKDRRSLIQKDSLREAFWYRRTFEITGSVPAVSVLKVSKAMFGTKVFLNGQDLGEHLPCFSPGYFNIAKALRKGSNELVIRVGSSRNSVPFSIPDGFDFEKDRYIPGIFDNVELILTGTPFIETVQTVPEIDKKQVRVQVKLDNPGMIETSNVEIVITEAGSNKVAGEVEKEISFMPGLNILGVTVPIESCRLWSPEDPFLYNVKVVTKSDHYETRFGMREFYHDTITGRPMLNGKPFYLRGTNVTLYRFFEDEACGDLPWNEDWVRTLHKSFKKFHWNSIRYCIGIAPEDWYRIADEEGILIQNEFPIWYGGKGWNLWPEELRAEELALEYTEWMQDQWNHPSIVIWDASNETVSHDGKTEEIAEAVKEVRTADLSHRPWDNSYSGIRKAGDVMELHPYHFQNAKFRLKDIASANTNPGGNPGETKFMKIINEYGWLWLNRDGTPTTLTNELYNNILGPNSTEEQRRHLYATYLAAETEFWRCHRQAAGVLHFTALGYSRSDGQTSDHFTDIANLVYEEQFMKYIPDAFSPAGLMLDEWGNEIRSGKNHDFRIIAINDLEAEWSGKVLLQILNGENVLAEKSEAILIPAYGQSTVTISLVTPELPGNHTVIASLNRDNEKPVKSTREIPFIK